MSASNSQYISDCVNIFLLSDERSSDHIDTLFESKFNDVILVLFGQSGQVYNAAWKVHVLFLADLDVILDKNSDTILNKKRCQYLYFKFEDCDKFIIIFS